MRLSLLNNYEIGKEIREVSDVGMKPAESRRYAEVLLLDRIVEVVRMYEHNGKFITAEGISRLVGISTDRVYRFLREAGLPRIRYTGGWTKNKERTKVVYDRSSPHIRIVPRA